MYRNAADTVRVHIFQVEERRRGVYNFDIFTFEGVRTFASEAGDYAYSVKEALAHAEQMSGGPLKAFYLPTTAKRYTDGMQCGDV